MATITIYDENGDEQQIPARWAICGRCDGSGTHDHPAFENGITSDEMLEHGEEFCEDYMRGAYDVRCTECDGSGKVLEGDLERLSEAEREAYEQQLEADADYAAECAAERRMGA